MPNCNPFKTTLHSYKNSKVFRPLSLSLLLFKIEIEIWRLKIKFSAVEFLQQNLQKVLWKSRNIRTVKALFLWDKLRSIHAQHDGFQAALVCVFNGADHQVDAGRTDGAFEVHQEDVCVCRAGI